MPEKEDVDNVKEFMHILSEVKVSVAEMNGKMDRVMDTSDDTKAIVEQLRRDHDETKQTANEANNRSITNEKNINKIEGNARKTNIALISVVGAFVLQIIFYMMTYNF